MARELAASAQNMNLREHLRSKDGIHLSNLILFMFFVHVLQLEVMLPVENQESSQSKRKGLSLDLTWTDLYLEGILCLIAVNMGACA